jgi:hypothetical protein
MTDMETPATTTTQNEIETIYKKWHRTGFIAVGYWPSADKLTIEIGSLDTNQSLKSATKCFIPVSQFVAYLRAEISGNLANIYPKYAESGLAFYGGGKTDKGVVSRVFKSTVWTSGGNTDPAGRAFKCGHFVGTRTEQGAVQPDYKQPLSADTIKMTLADLAEIFETIQLKVIAERVVALQKPMLNSQHG